MREATPGLVLNAARACRWPPLTVGAMVLSDRGAWEHVADGASPAELVQMLVLLGPSLLQATDGGRHHLAHQLEPRRDADIEPLVVGDAASLPIVRAALALTPPVVRYALLRDVVFLCVGISSGAWTSSSRFVDGAEREKSIAIVLGPAVDVYLVLHECAHAFLKETHEHSQAIGVAGEEGLRALAAGQGWADQVARHVRRDETLADALALAWYFAPCEAQALPA